jgi:hypothetical protein
LRRFALFGFLAALPVVKAQPAQPPDIPGWSALEAGVACLSLASLHRQMLPSSARFGRRVYISASGLGFNFGPLTGNLRSELRFCFGLLTGKS